MMSAYGSIDLAVQAMKEGAYDFISKPFKKDEVILSLRKAEERESLRSENRTLKKKLEKVAGRLGRVELIGESKAMKEVFDLIERVAPYDTSVLITGESGTGKELVARLIHNESPRVNDEFVAINCGSIPENLLESEFFGFEKGAFTGASESKTGLFEQADHGTLFLDEVGELPVELQVKFLRVLQEREVRPIGAASNKSVDVRVIAATSRQLYKEVENNRFRRDLLYRLNVVEIHLPPLREREGDLQKIAEHFVRKYSKKMGRSVSKISKSGLEVLTAYSWPGNVRELENCIEYALIYSDGNAIAREHFPPKIVGRQHEVEGGLLGFSTFSIKEAKRQVEKVLIERTLLETGGNRSQASELLEISYPALLNKIKQYGINVKKITTDK